MLSLEEELLMTSPSIGETADRVRSIIEHHLGQKVSDTARFDEIGLDSLEVIDLALEMEQRLHVDIPEEVIERLVTVGDVIRHVTELVTGSPRNPLNA
jgi:acyl carrier protein